MIHKSWRVVKPQHTILGNFSFYCYFKQPVFTAQICPLVLNNELVLILKMLCLGVGLARYDIVDFAYLE